MLKLVISFCRIGDQSLKITDTIEQITIFMAVCYGQPQCSTLTEARQKQWADHCCKTVLIAFTENVERAHLSVQVVTH